MNQLINLSPSRKEISGLFREGTIIIVADTSPGAFSVTIPEAFSSQCYLVKFQNSGSGELTLEFPSKSRLFLSSGSVTNIVVSGGVSFDIFNDPVAGKWHGVSDPSIRWIWEDNRLKGQVYQDGAWHTCIKGGY